MKNRKPLALTLGFAVFFGGLPVAAQAQNTQPQLYLRGDFVVDASRVGEYEAAVREILAGLEKYDFPFPFDTFSTDDNHYYILFPLKNYSEAELWSRSWGALSEKMGPENLQAVYGRMAAAGLELVYQFWYYRPDISFRPEKERLKPEEIGYYTWDFVYLIPGNEAEFEAVNKEWIALSKAKKARDPFLTYAGDLGTKMPVYVWVEYGKSASDYAVTEEKFWKSMGEEGAALSKKTRALIRKMESKTGRYRPDLSYSKGR